jgi:hypothetical protein
VIFFSFLLGALPSLSLFSLPVAKHLVRSHPLWNEVRVWLDAYYELKAVEAQSDESSRSAKAPPLSDIEDPECPLIIRRSELPSGGDKTDKLKYTLIAERLVYSMTKLEVTPRVIEIFISELTSKESLEKKYQDFLRQYLAFRKPGDAAK